MGICHSSPNVTTTANIWRGVGKPGFVFPEVGKDPRFAVPALADKPSVALCLSGGGNRAAVSALGVVRGLRQLDLLKDAKYISSCSGSSWFNVAYSYRDVEKFSEDAFLGGYVAPEDFPLAVLDEDFESASQFINCVARARLMSTVLLDLANDALTLELSKVDHVGAWNHGVGKSYLEPFGLFSDADLGTGELPTTFGLTGSYTAAVWDKPPHLATVGPHRPYPIVVGCVDVSSDSSSGLFRAVEFGPQYSGVPAQTMATVAGKLGGVLVESFALPSSAPSPDVIKDLPSAETSAVSKCETAQLSVPLPLSLTQIAGISSNYPALALLGGVRSDIAWDSLEAPRLRLWDGDTLSGNVFRLCDGGGNDYMALLPAVRRGVKKLVIMYSVASELPDPSLSLEEFTQAAASGAALVNLAAAFGRASVGQVVTLLGNKSEAGGYNVSSQVFSPASFDRVIASLREVMTTGGQLVRATVDVVVNAEVGVLSPYTAEVLFVFNMNAERWLSRLPEPIREAVLKESPIFPRVVTKNLSYSPVLANALSQFMNWSILEGADTVNAFLSA